VSISKFREFIEKSGCGWIIGIICAALMLFGLTGQCRGGSNGQPQPDGVTNSGPSVADVSGVPLSYEYLDAFTERVMSSAKEQSGGTITPAMESFYRGHAIDQSIIAACLLVLCERNHLDLNFEGIRPLQEKMFNDALAQQRTQWIKDGKLKADATQDQFNALYKTEYKTTTDEVKAQNEKGLKDSLEGPNGFDTKVSAANQLLTDYFAKKIPASTEDVRHSYDTYVTKRIILDKTKHPGEDLVAKLNQIKKEIQGGLTFEAAMDKYSDDQPAIDPKTKVKKAIHENRMEIDGVTININESYKPIKTLKPSEMSEPIGMSSTVELFQLQGITNSAPPDFTTKLDEYRKNFVNTRAVSMMQDAIKALKDEPNLIKWNSMAYHVMYDKQVYESDPKNYAADPATRRKSLEGFLDRAMKARDSDPAGARVATLVAYSTIDSLYGSASPAEKAAMLQKRIDILSSVAETLDDPDVSLTLVDLFIEKKDKEKIGPAFDRATSGNSSRFDANGQRIYADIYSKLTKAKSAGLLTPDQIKGIETKLDQWKKEKIDHDKFAAEEEKRAAAQAKKDEEDRKKAEAAAKKQSGGDKSKPKTPAPDNKKPAGK
jgi:hypothetical protein